MSDSGYLKSACQKCGGHLEFPPAGAGETIACPHCGAPTTLVANSAGADSQKSAASRQKIIAMIIVAMVFISVAAGIILYRAKLLPASSHPVSNPVPQVPTNPVPRIVFARLNDFNVGPVTLKKTEGSSLVYAVGIVQNDSGRQRFGVRIQLGVLDAGDNKIGTASDYISVIEPHKDWQFKALLTEPKAVKARPALFEEQK